MTNNNHPTEQNETDRAYEASGDAPEGACSKCIEAYELDKEKVKAIEEEGGTCYWCWNIGEGGTRG